MSNPVRTAVDPEFFRKIKNQQRIIFQRTGVKISIQKLTRMIPVNQNINLNIFENVKKIRKKRKY